MDRQDCDPIKLHRTYRQFKYVNRAVSGWHRIYARYIRPLALRMKHCSLLDIGFGGGDIPWAIHRWSRRDQIDLNITAIEEDPRALKYVESAIPKLPGLVYQHASTGELVQAERRFDFVISNHLMHHLRQDQLTLLGSQSLRLGKHVIHNDIERGDLAYALFTLIPAPFFEIRSLWRMACARFAEATAPPSFEQLLLKASLFAAIFPTDC